VAGARGAGAGPGRAAADGGDAGVRGAGARWFGSERPGYAARMASTLLALLRADLLLARRRRDEVAVAALRSALGALDNAGAVPEPLRVPDAPPPGDAPHATPHFAGSIAGPWAAEAPRRVLDAEAELGVLRREIAERLVAARVIEAGGDAAQPARLRAEAAVLERYLGGLG